MPAISTAPKEKGSLASGQFLCGERCSVCNFSYSLVILDVFLLYCRHSTICHQKLLALDDCGELPDLP